MVSLLEALGIAAVSAIFGLLLGCLCAMARRRDD